MYKVYDQNERREFEVSPEWLDDIPRKEDIEYLLLFRLPATGENLEVTYSDGSKMYYINKFGTWGQPYNIK